MYNLLALLISPPLYLVLSLLLVRKKPTFCILMLAIFAVTGSLKIIVGRARPESSHEGIHWFKGLDHDFRSFPSSHAATAFGTVLLLRRRWPYYALATLLSSTRVLSGAHHPSDVFFGALIGLLLAKQTPLLFEKTVSFAPPSIKKHFL